MTGSYSPELAAPQRMPEIDPAAPAMAGALRILARTHQKQVSAFVPKEGLRMRQFSLPSKDGETFSCLVIEPDTEEVLPGVEMIHGGAFYLPIQQMAAELASAYAEGLHARIFLPEYRLVPGHRAPAQLEDCRALWDELIFRSTAHRIDREKLLVLGDSAGAALAAGLCIILREDAPVRPKGQLLIYPALDDRAERYGSYTRQADAPWSPKANRLMWQAYLRDAGKELLPVLVPMRCGNLLGLPPAYIEPQEIDILCDEAEAYAAVLKKAGVPAELNRIEGSYHSFDSDLSSPLVRRVLAERIRAARQMLGL